MDNIQTQSIQTSLNDITTANNCFDFQTVFKLGLPLYDNHNRHANLSSDNWLQLLKELLKANIWTKKYSDSKTICEHLVKDFPNLSDGWLGFINLAQSQHQLPKVIEHSLTAHSKFPDLMQPYIILGSNYQSLVQYDKAEYWFKKLTQKFDAHLQGFEQLANIRYLKKDYQGCLNAWQKFITKTDDEKQLIKYGTALLSLYLYKEAKTFFEGMLDQNNNSMVGWHGLAITYQAMNQKKQAKECFEKAIQLSESENDPYLVDIIGSCHLSYSKEDYIQLTDKLKEQFPNHPFTMFYWCNTPLLTQPLATGYEDQLSRYLLYKEQYGNNPLWLEIYAEILRNTERLEKADALYIQLVEEYPYHLDINKGYCLTAHHRKDWETAKGRFEEFYKKFPLENSEIFFYYIQALYHLKEFTAIGDLYIKFNKKRFIQYPNSKHVNYLLGQLLVKNYKKAQNNKELLSYENNLTFNFEDTQISQLQINDSANDTLIVYFQGVTDLTKAHYHLHGFEDIEESLKKQNKYQDFDILGFANKSQKYNFLFLRDSVNSCFFVDTDKYLTLIQEKIKQLRPKNLICMGISGGGCASLLFSELLNANLTFALMPRMQPFFGEPSDYYYHLLNKHKFKHLEYLDYAYLQQKNQGFNTKKYLIMCEHYAPDSMIALTFDTNDPNLNISYCYGNIHGIMQYLGAKNIYQEVTRLIEAHKQTAFTCELKKDAFASIIGFKYNSLNPNVIKTLPQNKTNT